MEAKEPLKSWTQHDRHVYMFQGEGSSIVVYTTDCPYPIYCDDMTHANYTFTAMIARCTK